MSGARAGPAGAEGKALGESQGVDFTVEEQWVPLGPCSGSPSLPPTTPAWTNGMPTVPLCQTHWLPADLSNRFHEGCSRQGCEAGEAQ